MNDISYTMGLYPVRHESRSRGTITFYVNQEYEALEGVKLVAGVYEEAWFGLLVEMTEKKTQRGRSTKQKKKFKEKNTRSRFRWSCNDTIIVNIGQTSWGEEGRKHIARM